MSVVGKAVFSPPAGPHFIRRRYTRSQFVHNAPNLDIFGLDV